MVNTILICCYESLVVLLWMLIVLLQTCKWWCYRWHMVQHGLMTGMGTWQWDQVMMTGVAGDDWVTCTGHGWHDMLGEWETQMYAWKCNRSGVRSAQECSGWHEPSSGWGTHTATRNQRMDGSLASTMLSKLIMPWLSDRAWIQMRGSKESGERERADEARFNDWYIMTDEH